MTDARRVLDVPGGCLGGEGLTAILGHTGSGMLTLLACLARQCRPDTGEIRLDETPDSVAALSWELTEIAVDLGLPFTGVADVEGYRTWVGVPMLPENVRDRGLRNEPNLEAISELAPDLVLALDQ